MRVHVVDDNDSIGVLAAYALTSRGHHVTVTTSGFDGLFAPEPWEDVDVAVIDLWLGSHTTGAAILGYLIAHHPDIRRVVYTASGVPSDPMRALADAVVIKSANVAELAAAVEGT